MARNPLRVVLLKETNGRTEVRTIRMWDRDHGHIRIYQETYATRGGRIKVYERLGGAWDPETALPVFIHTTTEELPC